MKAFFKLTSNCSLPLRRGFLSRCSKLMSLFTVSVVGCIIIPWECDIKSSLHKVRDWKTKQGRVHLEKSALKHIVTLASHGTPNLRGKGYLQTLQ